MTEQPGSHERISFAMSLFLTRMLWRLRVMQVFRADLRQLLLKKVVVIAVESEGRVVYLCFNDGRAMLRRYVDDEARVKISFRSDSLAQSVFKSAMVGDQFWLSAMRDQRLSVAGDMSVVLWLFSLCRHLPLRRTSH